METLVFNMVSDIESKIQFFNEFVRIMSLNTVEPKSLEELQDRVLKEKVDNMLYSREASYLFSEIIFSITFLRSFAKIESEIISEFLKEKSDSFYKRRFHIKDEKIMENEEGFLDKQRNQILDSPEFKRTMEMLEKSSPQ